MRCVSLPSLFSSASACDLTRRRYGRYVDYPDPIKINAESSQSYGCNC